MNLQVANLLMKDFITGSCLWILRNFSSLLIGDFLVSASQTRAALLMQQSDMFSLSIFSEQIFM